MKGRKVGLYVAGVVVVAGIAAAGIVWGCRTPRKTVGPGVASINSVPESHWGRLAGMRVFFGHQSVGENIVDGIRDLMVEHPQIRLNIVESKDVGAVKGPAFIHAKLGRNTRPKSKILAFKRVANQEAFDSIDIAMLKLCYIDIDTDDDVVDVFDYYQKTISSIERDRPSTLLLHFTSPVESIETNVITKAKEVVNWRLDRPGVVLRNHNRERYSDLVRSAYSGRGGVFDIARLEATGPDGLAGFLPIGTEEVVLMDGRYTDDGGHLDSVGRRHVAEQLLITLAMAANWSETVAQQ